MSFTFQSNAFPRRPHWDRRYPENVKLHNTPLESKWHFMTYRVLPGKPVGTWSR